jgi:hypothetical protein
MVARAALEENQQLVRAKVWLGMTQLGAGMIRDAEESFRDAQSAWRRQRPDQAGFAATGDRLDEQLTEWIARSLGN